MILGSLDFESVTSKSDLLAESVANGLNGLNVRDIFVAKIDPLLSDTENFCEHYRIDINNAANCVVLEAKRSDRLWYIACVVLGANKVDVNGVVRRQVDARKISFAPRDVAVTLTKMEYGGVSPIGLPSDWPILIDTQVVQGRRAIIGSGLRGSKLLVSSELFAKLPNVSILDLAK